jgi:hypothetical protein
MNAHVNLDWRKAGDVGLYTVPMAARILREEGNRIRRWINGASDSDAPPIIHRQLPLIGGKTVLGFLDLIEARFIKHFKDLGSLIPDNSENRRAASGASQHGSSVCNEQSISNRWQNDPDGNR